VSIREDELLRYLAEQDQPTEDDVRAYLGQSDQPGKLASFGRGVAQGATLGFADEATAGLKALGAAVVPGGRGFRDTFSEEVEESRAEDQAARDAHGGYMLAGDLTGSLVTGLASGGAGLLGKGAATGTRLARTAATGTRLARQGAALGALEATGRAEGNLLERAPEAVAGGVVGGALAVGLPFVGRLAGRLAAPIGRVAGIQPRASTRAADEILDALTTPPEQLRGRLSGAADETLMELDAGARGLAERTQQIPGRHQAEMSGFLQGRVERQLPQVTGALEAGTGLQREGSSRLARQMMQERAAEASTKFPQAYARGPVQMTEGLATILSRPSVQRAYQQAGAIAGERGVPLAPLSAPDVRTLHLLKMGLDDVVARGKMPGEGGLGPALRYEYDQTRRALLREIKDVAPELAEAMDVYAGDSAMLEALDLGRTIFRRTPPQELSDMLADMTASEVEMFRRGAIDGVLDQLGNVATRNDLLKRFMDDPNDIARMGLLFDDPQEFLRFGEQMRGLAEQGVTRDLVTGNSRTALRQAGASSLEPSGLGNALRPTGMLDEFDRPFREESAQGTAAALSPMLRRTGDDLPSLLELLEGRAGTRTRNRAIGSAVTRAGAMGGGGGAGYLTSLLFGDGER
jgi:hypothetical protein